MLSARFEISAFKGTYTRLTAISEKQNCQLVCLRSVVVTATQKINQNLLTVKHFILAAPAQQRQTESRRAVRRMHMNLSQMDLWLCLLISCVN